MYHGGIHFKQVQNKSGTILKVCMGIAMLICLLVPASTAFAYTDSAHTSQRSFIASAASVEACANGSTSMSYVHCFAPTVKTYCSGPQYNGPVSDGRTMIDWTYTYGKKHCVTVEWKTTDDRGSSFLPNDNCSAMMYIPIHHATANVTFQFHYGSKTSVGSETIHQSVYTNGEFASLGAVKKTLTSITLQDDTGTYHEAKIG